MPNKSLKKTTHKQNSTNQSNISKFFNKSDTTCMKRKPVEINDASSGNSTTSKVPKLHHVSDHISKHELSELTITKIHSYSSNTTRYKCLRRDSTDERKTLFSKQNSKSPVKEHVDIENESETGSTKIIKYTPLEKQYLEFKNQYPDAILLIECGYKYKFFGEDAEIASKILNIACFKSHNFMSAIIPVQRMHYHVRRLVLKGYKVGLIKQTETAALKAAGDKKNDLFSRELQALYTKATLIGEEFRTPEGDEEISNIDIYNPDFETNYLMCISEVLSEDKKNNNIAIVAVNLASGDSLYSAFKNDSILRNKLESCLLHVSPSEILVPVHLSKETESLINGYAFENSARIEKLDLKHFDYTTAIDRVSCFYATNYQKSEDAMQTILAYPSEVVSCLSALIDYLSKFKLENILKNINMKLLSTDDTMILTSATLKGLEVVRNNSSHTQDKSLFWIINKTLTKFGERMLKTWILKPLKNLEKIEERLDILTEILSSDTVVYKVVETILSKLPDLERILCSVFYQKCSCFDFLKFIAALTKIQAEFSSLSDKISLEVKSHKMRSILCDIPVLLENVEKYLSQIDPEAAKLGDKTKVFYDLSIFPDLMKCKNKISNLEKKLNDLRPEIRNTLKVIDVKYATVSGQKFLIEVPNYNIARVPKEWLKISSTKQVSRYRSPEIIQYCKEMDQQNELLIAYANEAWYNYLKEFGNKFYKYKRAIMLLSELDCYLSLAKISKEEKFCRPQVLDTSDRLLNIVQGRHPVAEKIIDGKQFVANDICMDVVNNCTIVTGPNMGGKSTYVRQTAIIALLAHIGSYVPAESAVIPLFDNIYVRMGADDDLTNRRSTFMVEMCEASEILNNATCKSFAVLDELGRGTSTNDGTAVAYSSLEYLIFEIKCLTLFVTHYPEILELKDRFKDKISTVTMAYLLKDNNDDTDIETVTFLYNVVSGVSDKSYGINVAALSGIPKNILNKAHEVSQSRRIKTEILRHVKNLAKKIKSTDKSKLISS